jgi:E3 ubiquitin-protein ligase EDD1
MPKMVNIPLQFVVHPLPGSAEQLGEKLREVGERLRRGNFGLPSIPSVSAALGSGSGSQAGGSFGSPNVLVSQIEVGPSHFAFLLDDGRVCRLPFSVISDRLDLNRTSMLGMVQSGGSGSGIGKSVSKVTHASTNSGINMYQFALRNERCFFAIVKISSLM